MKKFILILLIIFLYSPVHADQFTGTLEGIRQDTDFYLTYDSVDYKVVDTSMIPFILDSYRSGIPVTVDYNLQNEVNFIFTEQVSGYPMQDLSTMVSFIIGGISAMCFVGAVRLRFMG